MSAERLSRRRAGFTLVELLTVIGIIAIIAAVLIPVLSAARERGSRTVCQSNLRQLAMAVQQYVQDNGGIYPLQFTTEDRGGGSYALDWSQLIYPYVKDNQIFRCPDHPSDAPWGVVGSVGTNNPPYTDFTYDNIWLNVFPPPYPTKNVHGAREADLATPATTWLNVDAEWSTPDGTQHYGRAVKTSCGRSFFGSTLHSDGGDYSFADGHVKWLTPEAMGEIECAQGPLPAPFKD